MRRLVLKMSLSLDGFVRSADGGMAWLTRNRDDGAAAWIAETLWQAGVHAMGSRTFAEMAGFWPTADGPLAAPMNAIPKIVFTRRPKPDLAASTAEAGWAGAEIAQGDLADEILRLKRAPGKDILAHGGVGFAQSLARLGLVDEYRLLVHPVALGAGSPLFADLPARADLRLISTSVFGSGVVAQVYRPA